MQTIKLCDFGKSLGTRALAREIRIKGARKNG